MEAKAGPSQRVAVIDEQACIGCALCLEACPVDAIVGAARFMHTVIAGECTGCGWCVPPCPVDCIEMADRAGPATHAQRHALAQQYRRRYAARQARLGRERRERIAASGSSADEARKQAAVTRAVQRARDRLQSRRDK